MTLVTSLTWLITMIIVMLAVAFFTLFERKLMGLVHLRVGPNKLSFMGLVQPLLDAIKLLTKSWTISSFTNNFLYLISPFISLLLSLSLWLSIPLIFHSWFFVNSLLFFAALTSVLVFPVLATGWASNSKYSLIGCLRSVSQSISYEAVFSTLILLFSLLWSTYNVESINHLQSWMVSILFFPLWLFSVLAESHRAPFDFSESESELVSGFNTEYSGGFFAFIFVSEYSTLLVSSIIMVLLFIPVFPYMYVLFTLFMTFMIVMIRVTYCRFRYDLLMIVAWKSFVPVSVMFVICLLCTLL